MRAATIEEIEAEKTLIEKDVVSLSVMVGFIWYVCLLGVSL